MAHCCCQHQPAVQVWSALLASLVSILALASRGNAFSTTPTKSSTISTIKEVPIFDPSGDDDTVSPTEHPKSSSSIGDRIQQGESVVQIANLVSPEECQYIVKEVLQLDATPTELETPGLLRLPTRAAAERAALRNTPCADPLPPTVDSVLQEILARAADVISNEIPSISETLFGGESLSELLCTDRLTFSSREPAINVYSPGGEFLAHKDAQALTILIPLSCPQQDFSGGGTSFWSQDSRGHRVEDPTVVLRPSAGTAMLFGGCVTHAGVPIEEGTRVVFVASFSKSGEKATAVVEQRDLYGDSL